MESAIEPVVETGSKRRYRTVEEKRRIVEETMAGGISIAQVARRHGVNANLVFHWRKLYQGGLLGLPSRQTQADASRLLPVRVVEAAESGRSAVGPSSGAIHIEFAGQVRVRVESRAEAGLVRVVLESLRG